MVVLNNYLESKFHRQLMQYFLFAFSKRLVKFKFIKDNKNIDVIWRKNGTC
jgi:hypothetical protein